MTQQPRDLIEQVFQLYSVKVERGYSFHNLFRSYGVFWWTSVRRIISGIENIMSFYTLLLLIGSLVALQFTHTCTVNCSMMTTFMVSPQFLSWWIVSLTNWTLQRYIPADWHCKQKNNDTETVFFLQCNSWSTLIWKLAWERQRGRPEFWADSSAAVPLLELSCFPKKTYYSLRLPFDNTHDKSYLLRRHNCCNNFLVFVSLFGFLLPLRFRVSIIFAIDIDSAYFALPCSATTVAII